MMCNQCQDLRRIHSGKIVYGVFHNGKMLMVLGKESQAHSTINILKGNGWCQCAKDAEDCVWEVFQIDRKSVSWER